MVIIRLLLVALLEEEITQWMLHPQIGADFSHDMRFNWPVISQCIQNMFLLIFIGIGLDKIGVHCFSLMTHSCRALTYNLKVPRNI